MQCAQVPAPTRSDTLHDPVGVGGGETKWPAEPPRSVIAAPLARSLSQLSPHLTCTLSSPHFPRLPPPKQPGMRV